MKLLTIKPRGVCEALHGCVGVDAVVILCPERAFRGDSGTVLSVFAAFLLIYNLVKRAKTFFIVTRTHSETTETIVQRRSVICKCIVFFIPAQLFFTKAYKYAHVDELLLFAFSSPLSKQKYLPIAL